MPDGKGCNVTLTGVSVPAAWDRLDAGNTNLWPQGGGHGCPRGSEVHRGEGHLPKAAEPLGQWRRLPTNTDLFT